MSTEEKEKVVKKEEKIFLNTFLDSQELTRAEKSYYQKKYAEYKDAEKTLVEWNKIVKFTHK